jgi:hypothetical protein
VTEAHAINDRGEIVAISVFPNGNQHVVLLVPSDLAASEGLTSNAPAPGTTGPLAGTTARPVSCVHCCRGKRGGRVGVICPAWIADW